MIPLRYLKRRISFLYKSNKSKPGSLHGKLRPFKKVKFILFLAALISAVFYLSKLDLFSIRQVNVSFSGLTMDIDGITDFTKNNFLGKSIIFVDENNFRNLLKRNYIVVDEVELSRSFPGKINAKVYERRPLGIVQNIGEGVEATPSSYINLSLRRNGVKESGWLTDADGFVFAENKSEGLDLPFIYITNKHIQKGISLKDPIDTLMFDIVRETSDFENNVILVSQIGLDIIVVLNDSTYLLFSTEKSVLSQVDIAKKVLEKYKIEAKKLAKIDLRFKNPVVEFKQ